MSGPFLFKQQLLGSFGSVHKREEKRLCVRFFFVVVLFACLFCLSLLPRSLVSRRLFLGGDTLTLSFFSFLTLEPLFVLFFPLFFFCFQFWLLYVLCFFYIFLFFFFLAVIHFLFFFFLR